MAYYFSRTLETSFDDAVEKLTASLFAEGFGVISDVNLHEKINTSSGSISRSTASSGHATRLTPIRPFRPKTR